MNLDTNIELIQFINNEKKPSKLLKHKKAYIYFNTCLLKTILELVGKFKDKKLEVLENTITGINTFCHVFFVLLGYTNNLKLTIFLAERAVLLYTEFVIMSMDSEVTDEMNNQVTNRDAMLFSYKKTIGPIKLNEIITNDTLINIKYTCSLIKTLYISFIKKNTDTIVIEDFKILDSNFSHLFLKLTDKTNSKTELRQLLHKRLNDFLNCSQNVYTCIFQTKCILEHLLRKTLDKKYLTECMPCKYFSVSQNNLHCLRKYKDSTFYNSLV